MLEVVLDHFLIKKENVHVPVLCHRLEEDVHRQLNVIENVHVPRFPQNDDTVVHCQGNDAKSGIEDDHVHPVHRNGAVVVPSRMNIVEVGVRTVSMCKIDRERLQRTIRDIEDDRARIQENAMQGTSHLHRLRPEAEDTVDRRGEVLHRIVVVDGLVVDQNHRQNQPKRKMSPTLCIRFLILM